MCEHKSSRDCFGEDLKNLTFILVGHLGLGRMPRHATSWLQSNYSFLKTQCQSGPNEESNILLFYQFIIYFQFCKKLLLLVRREKCLLYNEVSLNYCLKILYDFFMNLLQNVQWVSSLDKNQLTFPYSCSKKIKFVKDKIYLIVMDITKKATPLLFP